MLRAVSGVPGTSGVEPPTFGVEEEFHLVDPGTRRLAPAAERVLAADASDSLEPELQRSMVETGTPVCRTLAELREQLVARRAIAAAAAGRHGLRLVAAGTCPTPAGPGQAAFPEQRYESMTELYGQVGADMRIASCQVQVGVEDRELAVVAAGMVRRWLPVLLALSGSSPFWEGADTEFSSYRTMVWSRWPTAGPPSSWSGAAHYDALIERLLGTGVILDRGMVYFDIRPSHRYPTLEVRISDACPLVDDALLLAGLARALVTTAVDAVRAGAPVDDADPELLRAASWRAARSGLGGQLLHPWDWTPAPAAEIVAMLLEHVRPALDAAADLPTVEGLLAVRIRDGESAARQRALFRRTGSLDAVVDSLIAETALA